MTARPHDPDSRRRPLCVVVAVVLVMAAMVIAAGCTSQNPSTVTPVLGTITNTNISLTPTISPQTQSVLRISPVSECPEINSTTNPVLSGESFKFSHSAIRPEGNLVRIWIFGDKSASWVTRSVRSGIMNTITVDGNLTSRLKTGTYYLLFEYSDDSGNFKLTTKDANHPDQIINSDGDLILDLQRVRNGYIKGLEARSFLEQVTNGEGKNERSENSSVYIKEPWIIINPVQDIKRGTRFTINGITNLPADHPKNMILKLTIWPTQLDPRLLSGEQSVEDYGSAFSAILDIERSDDCINTFSIDVPGINAKSGEYFVSVIHYDRDGGNLGFVENQTRFNIK